MGTYWTNFAKYGQPNDGILPEWPVYQRKSTSDAFRPQSPLGPVPDEESLWVMDRYFKWRRSEEGKKWAE